MVVKLSKIELKKVFNDLVDGVISREEADRWAYEIIQSFDRGSLEFVPPSDEAILWDGVQYLFGIDIMEEPGEYLHTLEEIEDAFNQKWNN